MKLKGTVVDKKSRGKKTIVSNRTETVDVTEVELLKAISRSSINVKYIIDVAMEKFVKGLDLPHGSKFDPRSDTWVTVTKSGKTEIVRDATSDECKFIWSLVDAKNVCTELEYSGD